MYFYITGRKKKINAKAAPWGETPLYFHYLVQCQIWAGASVGKEIPEPSPSVPPGGLRGRRSQEAEIQKAAGYVLGKPLNQRGQPRGGLAETVWVMWIRGSTSTDEAVLFVAQVPH